MPEIEHTREKEINQEILYTKIKKMCVDDCFALQLNGGALKK